MCDALVWFFDAIKTINWLDVIRSIASVATAVVAALALRNWQRQDKAKREAEFLDTLIETTHTYIAEMPTPVTLLELAKIGMKSREPTWEDDDEADKEVKGAIAYITECGERDAKRLLDVLKAVQPSTIRLRSLAAKGQVFKFDNYGKCQNAITTLTWHFDRIEAFTAVIGSPTWSWEHPEVLKYLKDIVAIDPKDIRESLEVNNVALIEFSADTYKQIYG